MGPRSLGVRAARACSPQAERLPDVWAWAVLSEGFGVSGAGWWRLVCHPAPKQAEHGGRELLELLIVEEKEAFRFPQAWLLSANAFQGPLQVRLWAHDYRGNCSRLKMPFRPRGCFWQRTPRLRLYFDVYPPARTSAGTPDDYVGSAPRAGAPRQ